MRVATSLITLVSEKVPSSFGRGLGLTCESKLKYLLSNLASAPSATAQSQRSVCLALLPLSDGARPGKPSARGGSFYRLLVYMTSYSAAKRSQEIAPAL